MSVTDMREALINMYSDTIRGRKVAWMPDSQVIAIYHSLIDRKDRHIEHPRPRDPPKGEQMRMEFE